MKDPLRAKSDVILVAQSYIKPLTLTLTVGGHGSRVVTLLPPTSEARVRYYSRPQVGKLIVPCRWSAVYSTES